MLSVVITTQSTIGKYRKGLRYFRMVLAVVFTTESAVLPTDSSCGTGLWHLPMVLSVVLTTGSVPYCPAVIHVVLVW